METKFDEICPVETSEGGQWVDARRLHEALQVGRDFSTWIKRRIESVGYVEGTDYKKSVMISGSPVWGSASDKASGECGQGRIDYMLTIGVAKELCMLEKNEVGRMARRYFIACEEELRKRSLALPQDYVSALRALADSEERKAALELQCAELVKTKAWIGSRREATAMATASVAVRRANALAEELGKGKTWKQAAAIPWLEEYFVKGRTALCSVGRELARLSRQLGFEIGRVESSEYRGGVGKYRIEVINRFKKLLDEDPGYMKEIRVKEPAARQLQLELC